MLLLFLVDDVDSAKQSPSGITCLFRFFRESPFTTKSDALVESVLARHRMQELQEEKALGHQWETNRLGSHLERFWSPFIPTQNLKSKVNLLRGSHQRVAAKEDLGIARVFHMFTPCSATLLSLSFPLSLSLSLSLSLFLRKSSRARIGQHLTSIKNKQLQVLTYSHPNKHMLGIMCVCELGYW